MFGDSVADGIVNITLPAGAVTDRALDPNIPTWLAFTYDDTRPNIDLATFIRFPTNASRVRVTATFSGSFNLLCRFCAVVEALILRVCGNVVIASGVLP